MTFAYRRDDRPRVRVADDAGHPGKEKQRRRRRKRSRRGGPRAGCRQLRCGACRDLVASDGEADRVREGGGKADGVADRQQVHERAGVRLRLRLERAPALLPCTSAPLQIEERDRRAVRDRPPAPAAGPAAGGPVHRLPGRSGAPAGRPGRRRRSMGGRCWSDGCRRAGRRNARVRSRLALAGGRWDSMTRSGASMPDHAGPAVDQGADQRRRSRRRSYARSATSVRCGVEHGDAGRDRMPHARSIPMTVGRAQGARFRHAARPTSIARCPGLPGSYIIGE